MALCWEGYEEEMKQWHGAMWWWGGGNGSDGGAWIEKLVFVGFEVKEERAMIWVL